MEEYRFQVNLNWQRAQYLLGLNAAIISVGAGLIQLGPEVTQEDGAPLTVAVFVVGLVLAVFSTFAVWKQHDYYRTTRNRMVHIGGLLDLGSLAVATTPGAMGVSPRRLKVQTVTYAVLVALAGVDLFGAVYVASR
ncbi:MAG TPA: hypothetical protein VMZ51_04275 [Acidimicrobiales bacterium]|nr:hypothetical protein [Acidimicrobiales bacterium]